MSLIERSAIRIVDLSDAVLEVREYRFIASQSSTSHHRTQYYCMSIPRVCFIVTYSDGVLPEALRQQNRSCSAAVVE